MTAPIIPYVIDELRVGLTLDLQMEEQ